jgi:polyhydroxybutyrate depolymerase
MDAASQQAAMDMRPQADDNTFILVYPEGLGEQGASCQIWNSGPYQDPSQNKTSTDDLGFTEALVQDLSSTYSIDQDRIYATGFSNGGFMAYALACYRSEIFAAVGPIAAMMQDEELSPDGASPNPCSPSHPTPLIHLHGSEDEQVGVAFGDTAVEYWREHNQTTDTSTTTVKDRGTTIERHTSTGGTAPVEYYKIVGGSHETFSNIRYEGAGSAQLIWDFFSQHQMSTLR